MNFALNTSGKKINKPELTTRIFISNKRIFVFNTTAHDVERELFEKENSESFSFAIVHLKEKKTVASFIL